MRLLRTLRLDASDAFVFDRAAEPGQWAVSGAFMFDPAGIDALPTKARVAFRSGFLGIADFGWSTLAVVVAASAAERAEAVEALAHGLTERLGAPSLEIARAAAKEEIAFAETLADQPEGTLVAVKRSLVDGEAREQFRTLARRTDVTDTSHPAARVFQIVESVDGPADEVDLAALAGGKAP